MFEHLRNIDTAFKHVRLFSAVLIVAASFISGYSIYQSINLVREAQSKVYVIAPTGQTFAAVESSRADNLAIEARLHVELFHQYFFSILPDDKSIERNIRKALYLADHSAKQQYDILKEAGYYTRAVSANMTQELITDSISINLTTQPYYFTYYAKQRIVRPTAIVIRNLKTEGYLRDLKVRTDQNPSAFLIERWTVVDNRDMELIKR